jgi:hypothetical protein
MCSPRLDLYVNTSYNLPLNSSLLCAFDTSIIATFRQSTLLVIYVDTDCNNLEHWLQDWIIVINIFKAEAYCSLRLREASKCSVWKSTLGCLSWHSSLSWNDSQSRADLVDTHKSGRKEGIIGPLLYIKCGPSVGNCVAFHNQLIRHMIKYSCPIHSFVASTHIRKLQMVWIMLVFS